MRLWLLLPLLLAAAAGSPEYDSAVRKLDRIEAGQVPPRTALTFTLREINAYARGRAEQAAPGAVRNARIVLEKGQAAAYAMVDFVKLRAANGEAPGRLFSALFSGEHPVSIKVHLQSSKGRCQVDVDRVEVSGIPIEGRALDFLVDNFLIPYVPDAKIGQPFELNHRVDRIELASTGARVVIAQ